MNDETKKDAVVVAKKAEQVIEYQAYGGDTKVRLTLELIRTMIAVPTRAGNLPTQRDCYQFAMLCKARGLNPFEGDAFLVGYETKNGPKFNLITSHQAFLKRAELSPEFDGMESGVVVKTEDGKIKDHQGDFVSSGEKLVGGWARVAFKQRKIPTYRRINLERFKEDYGVWEQNPETMIVKCAEADALRSSFPTKMGGLYLREEMGRIADGKSNLATPASEGGVDVLPAEPEPPSLIAARLWGEQSAPSKPPLRPASSAPEQPEVGPANRVQLIAETKTAFASLKPSSCERCLVQVGLSLARIADGEAWEMLPDADLIKFAGLVRDEAGKRKTV